MMSHSSPRGGGWGPTLVINIVALSFGSYLALIYHSAATRRLLAEYVPATHDAPAAILCPCIKRPLTMDGHNTAWCLRVACVLDR